MLGVKVHVRMDMQPLRRFMSAVRNGMAGAPGPVDDMYKKWADRYLTFAQRRFDISSSGGGDWAALDPKTVARRRFGGGQTIGGARRKTLSRLRRSRKNAAATRGVKRLKRIAHAAGNTRILKDTGTLRMALAKGAPGNLIQRIPNGIRVGIGGDGRHPGGMTIGRLAAIHQAGNRAKGLPARRIIVPPDAQTISGFSNDAKRALVRLMRESR